MFVVIQIIIIYWFSPRASFTGLGRPCPLATPSSPKQTRRQLWAHSCAPLCRIAPGPAQVSIWGGWTYNPPPHLQQSLTHAACSQWWLETGLWLWVTWSHCLALSRLAATGKCHVLELPSDGLTLPGSKGTFLLSPSHFHFLRPFFPKHYCSEHHLYKSLEGESPSQGFILENMAELLKHFLQNPFLFWEVIDNMHVQKLNYLILQLVSVVKSLEFAIIAWWVPMKTETIPETSPWPWPLTLTPLKHLSFSRAFQFHIPGFLP